MMPQGLGRVFMHPRQLVIERAACRVEPIADGEYVTTFFQAVTINKRLPEQGIFYRDNPAVMKVLADEERIAAYKQRVAEHKARWGTQT